MLYLRSTLLEKYRYYCPIAAIESFAHMGFFFILELSPNQNLVHVWKGVALGDEISQNSFRKHSQKPIQYSIGASTSRHSQDAELLTQEKPLGLFQMQLSQNITGVLLLEGQEKCGYFWLSKTELLSVTKKSENTLGFQVCIFQKQ